MNASSLLLSPLTDSEVYERADAARHYVAHRVLAGDHEPDSYWRAMFDKHVEELRLLDNAHGQRLYRRPNGLLDLVAEWHRAIKRA
jgi:hypothetical protein